MLRVAVGKRDTVALLVQPGGEMNGDRRLADSAFAICDYDNHAPHHILHEGMLASIIYGWLTRRLAGEMGCRHAGLLASKHDHMTSCRSADKPDCRPDVKKAIRHVSMHARWQADQCGRNDRQSCWHVSKQTCKSSEWCDVKTAAGTHAMSAAWRVGHARPVSLSARGHAISHSCRLAVMQDRPTAGMPEGGHVS